MARAADEKTTLGSVWLRPEPAETRSPLSRAHIVKVAIAILDSEGLDNLTMRRMAVELGTAATSALYWRVATKNDLLELTVDAVIGEAALDDLTGDWRAQLETLARRVYDVLRHHPWASQLLGSHAGLGPNYQAYAERVLEILADAGFTGEGLDAAVSAVFHYVVGAAVADAAWTATIRRSGLSNRDWAAAAGDQLGVGTSVLASYLSRDDLAGPEARFVAGLRAILGGVEDPLEVGED